MEHKVSDVPGFSSLIERYADTYCNKVEEFLLMVAAIRGRPRDGWYYNSYEHCVLDAGRNFTWKPMPPGFRLGIQKQCFLNSIRMVLEEPERFVYCEGWATWTDGIPVQHAWVLDLEDGKVIDPTWRSRITERGSLVYFGVPFDTDFTYEAADKFGSVFDYRWRTNPVLKGPFSDQAWVHSNFIPKSWTSASDQDSVLDQDLESQPKSDPRIR